jgi:hypothetical protein
MPKTTSSRRYATCVAALLVFGIGTHSAIALSVAVTNFRGPWVSTANYQPGAIVTFSGASYICLVAASGVLPTSSSTSWSILDPPGAAGPQGQQGPAGPAGATGAKGATGLTGPVGATGISGATGPGGAVGPAGATGPAGSTGPAGPIGPGGTPGIAGPQGAVGATGAVGAQGAQGNAGPQGSMGPQGLSGPQGAAGPQGSSGGVYVKDSNGAIVGQYFPLPGFQFETVRLTAQGKTFYAVITADGFNESAQLYYESLDCTGASYIFWSGSRGTSTLATTAVQINQILYVPGPVSPAAVDVRSIRDSNECLSFEGEIEMTLRMFTTVATIPVASLGFVPPFVLQ